MKNKSLRVTNFKLIELIVFVKGIDGISNESVKLDLGIVFRIIK